MQRNDLAEDLLQGADEIGAFMGLKRRQVYHLWENSDAPFFRPSPTSKSPIWARKSALRQWIAEREAKAREARSNG